MWLAMWMACAEPPPQGPPPPTNDGKPEDTDTPPEPTPEPSCGDGVVQEDRGEACDDGSANADDGACTSACQVATCGDGLIHDGVEGCDDGAANADDAACTSACQVATCGDGLIHDGVEGCDDGNAEGGDGCSPTCQLPQRRPAFTADLRLVGVDDDRSGISVSSAGDVNGDGFDDLVIGAYTSNTLVDDGGGAYIVYGPILGDIDLATADAFLSGQRSGDEAGAVVRGAGDLNGDGFGDLVISAPEADVPPASYVGAVYVVYGPVAGTISLAAADAKLVGSRAGDSFGASVGAGGDLNGDGYDDLVVGAPGSGRSGAAHVFYGPLPAGTTDASAADATILGQRDSDDLGDGVAIAGDLNGDGIDDLAVGAPSYDDGPVSSVGAVYVFHGPVLGAVDPAAADATLLGESTGSLVGVDLDGAGDMNGDGFADLVIGCFGCGTAGFEDAGGAYVVYGPVTGTASLSTVAARFTGEAANDRAGQYVAGVGDVNDDGYDDILVGAPQSGTAGVVYLVQGPVSGSHSLALAERQLTGVNPGDQYGFGIGGGGDWNGDGIDDFGAGAYLADGGGMYRGVTYIELGAYP